MFTKLFMEVYINIFLNKYGNRKRYFNIDEQELEPVLEEYIMKVMGYKVINQYHNYLKNPVSGSFPYFGEIKCWFINVINNFDLQNSNSMIESIKEYGDNFYDNLEKYKYVNALIKGIKRVYSNDDAKVVIQNMGKSYKIGLLDDKCIDSMPIMQIDDIDNLNKILQNYIELILKNDNNFKILLRDDYGLTPEEALIEILLWTVRNASISDAINLEYFFSKYQTFLIDDTFSDYSQKPVRIGTLLDDELYLVERKSTIAYETPFYLSYMLKDYRVELPNIRMGIENTGSEKRAHILSIQSTQTHINKTGDKIINELIKSKLPKSPNFREYNPSHLISLLITIGILSGLGINQIEAYIYLPMRYQRFVLEQEKSHDELCQYQHRLTNKFINTFFRLMEFTKDIYISSYPENNSNLILKMNEQINFDDAFLNEIYMTGYKLGCEMKAKDKVKTRL